MPHPETPRLAQAPTFRLIESHIPVAGSPEDADITLSLPKRAVRVADGTLIEGRERPLPDEIFKDMAFRCTENGLPIVRTNLPLFVQYQALKLAGEQMIPSPDLSGHRDDLIALRAALPLDVTDIEDLDLLKDAMMFDALRASPRDPKLPQADLEAAAPAAPHRPEIDPVLLRMEADTRISPDQWKRVIDLPGFMAEPLRAIARQMLAPVLGNAADLEDMRVLPLPFAEVERAAAVRNWLRRAPETRDMEPFTTPSMPGYVTSPPIFSEKDGVGVVYFEDFQSAYAYAFQTNPDLTLEAPPAPHNPRLF